MTAARKITVATVNMAFTSARSMTQEQLRLVARTLRRGGESLPDVLVMQDVCSEAELWKFNQECFGGSYYPFITFSAGIGILRKCPVEPLSLKSHRDEEDKDGYRIFIQDCIEATMYSLGGLFTLFVCRSMSEPFLSPGFVPNYEARRLAEMERVAQIVQERFPGESLRTAPFAVIGDINDYDSQLLKPLLDLGLEDVSLRLSPDERWTDYMPNRNLVMQVPHILVSPALSRLSDSVPHIERRGLLPGNKITYFELSWNIPIPVPFDFERFPGADKETFVSLHAPLFFEVTLK